MKYLNLFFILSLNWPLWAEPISTTDVNAARQAAGMRSLSYSPELAKAAQSHADYLAKYMSIEQRNYASAHEENPSVPEFTGSLAPQRVQNFNYPHSQVLENISIGNETIADSVSDLMSAIYHRFAFLDFDIDEIGAASVRKRYVYEMGKFNISQTCLDKPSRAKLKPVYNCLGTLMKQSAFNQTCNDLPATVLFTPPYPKGCPNGKRLRSDYMHSVCNDLPQEAIFSGKGGYYQVCEDNTKVNAGWLNKLCEQNDESIMYGNSGKAYGVCQPQVKVHAAWYEQYCSDISESNQQVDSGRFYSVCDNDFKIKAEYYDQLHNIRLNRQPEAVVWPADGLEGIKPVFYDESPHPTPDLPMTGYPISIQFNPTKAKQVVISGFTLEILLDPSEQDWTIISDVRRIDHSNDINQKFDEHQFAWFPLQRLKWNAQYRYTIDSMVNGEPKQYKALFKTASFEVPLYQIDGANRSINVSTKKFILYRAPDGYDPLPFRDLSLRYNRRAKVDVNVIDSNTVEFDISSKGCSPIFLNMRLGDELRINLCARN